MSQGVAIVFPGQGSQSIGMLELYFSKEKKFNYVFDQSKEVLGVDFKDLVLNGTPEDLSPTEITQPLMLTANNAIWECLEIQPEQVVVMAGHSLGEFSALVAAKSLTFEDALTLVSSVDKALTLNGLEQAVKKNPRFWTEGDGASDGVVLTLGSWLSLVALFLQAIQTTKCHIFSILPLPLWKAISCLTF